MTPEWVPEIGMGLLVIGFIGLYEGAPGLRLVYHLFRNDPVPVRDLEHRSEPTEIEGTTRRLDDQFVRAPFSDTPCLAYEYEVEEYQSSGKNSSWETVDEGSDAVPFLVEDRTGTVEVDPTGAKLSFDGQTIRVDGGERPPDRIAQYIHETDAVEFQHDQSVDILVTELDTGNDQRFAERRLDIGESAHVYGDVERGSTGEWGSRRVDARLTDSDELSTMVVSDSSERETIRRIGKPVLMAAGGVVASLAGIVLLAYGFFFGA